MKIAFKILSASALLTFLLVGGIAHAATNDLSGYAWSSTIGWVSFAGPGYAVSVAGNGNLSGYAWSPNVGWISLNGADTTGCPSGACQASFDKQTGKVTGWAKVVAGGGI